MFILLSMYIFIYVYIYIDIYVCIYIYKHTNTNIYTNTYILYIIHIYCNYLRFFKHTYMIILILYLTIKYEFKITSFTS